MKPPVERRSPDKYGKYLSLLLPTLIAIAGISGTWAVYGERIDVAKEERTKLAAEHEKFVTGEVLDLKLQPIQQDIEYTKEAVKRVEQSNWEILKRLKALNDEPLGAHSR